MGKYQAYPEYKDSEIDWIGDIPNIWKVSYVKYWLELPPCYGILKPDKYEGTDGIKVIRILDVADRKVKSTQLESVSPVLNAEYKRTQIKDGDLVVSVVGTLGRSFICDKTLEGMNLSRALARLQVKSKSKARFLQYLIDSKSFDDYTNVTCTGAAQKVFNMEDLSNWAIPEPPSSDIETIANFLDHETAKIDTLIEKQQQLIKLLKEKRQAVISHAVTKGLNPDAPMKDSGVEWLGEVPEHWSVCKLKWKARTTSGGTPTTSKYELYYEGGDISWIRTTDLNNGVLRDAPIRITQKAVNDTACSLLPLNSVLLAMYGGAGSIGKHSLLKFESTINQAVCGILPTDSFNPEYLHRFYEFYRPFWMIGAAGTRKDPNIGQDDIKEGKVLLPPLSEQEAISSYIDEIQSRFDLLTKKAEEAITFMQERRTALISAAVTGKIDVRNWQVSEQEVTQQEAS
ncbi:restriction endonuclease subunit S [Vibrio sp. 665]|uniref:restriction endonuclease subunit S n=1 Tax=Vibrio sp. 665 TaxID=3074609 RepID=UPI0029652EAC|nr:restriction endonuclease subunit S [Vibrio sp. 665]MDW2032970.1 restriction endonuclease subunit S [Vibrio sp. 665]